MVRPQTTGHIFGFIYRRCVNSSDFSWFGHTRNLTSAQGAHFLRSGDIFAKL